MSDPFYCPGCKQKIAELPLTAPAHCAKCDQDYWYPNQPLPAAMIPQAQPIQAPAGPPPFQAIKSQARQAIQSRFTQADSWLDLFDWRFERYLTPMIIRLTWAVCVFFFALYLLFTVGGTLISMLPEGGGPGRSSRNTEERIVGNQRIRTTPAEFRAPSVPSWFNYRLLQIVFMIFAVLGSILVLLWVRMALEMAIVVFHIANSLSAIERNQT